MRDVRAHGAGALVGPPSCVWGRPGRPGTQCHVAPRGLAASWGVRTLVSHARRAVRAGVPVTRGARRLVTRAGRPGGGAPLSPTACVAGPARHRAASPSPTAAA